MVTSWLPRRNSRISRERKSPEPGRERRLERMFAVRIGIVARAEQGEVVARQPFEKLDRFGDLLDRQRRRVVAQVRDDLARARQHGLPILHADAHLGEDFFERANDVRPLRRILQAVDMNVNEAFALAVALARALEADKGSRRVALDREHRMHEQANVETAFVEFADHRIDEERHVVIDDVEHRYPARHGGGLEAHFGRTGLRCGEKRPRLLGDRSELLRPVALQILRHCEPEKLGEKIHRDAGLAQRQRRGGRADERLAGAVALGAGTILDGHDFPCLSVFLFPCFLTSLPAQFFAILLAQTRTSATATYLYLHL